MPDTQPLNSIVDVVVEVSPMAAPRPSFNQGLVIGPSTVIPEAERVRKYSSTSEMLSDGFTTASAEYKAVEQYFSQKPAPRSVWVGRKGVGQTAVDAVISCRNASPDWYVCAVPGALKADHEAIAAYIETAAPSSAYFYATEDADVLSGAANNIFEKLKGLGYERSLGLYSVTGSAAGALMGVAMGLNTGLANSAYTLKFKELVGVGTSSLTATQVNNIGNNNGNMYLSYGGYYKILLQGKVSSGKFFDEIIGLDMLVSDLQLGVMDLLYGSRKVPQTDEGINQLVHACNEACNLSLNRGFLGAGEWTGPTILSLVEGAILPSGYLVQAESLADQSNADRQARKAPPIYVSIKEAGAVHSLTIGVYVNR
jgi:hypothetical protein